MFDRLSKKLSERIELTHSCLQDSYLFKSCVYFSNWSVYSKKHFPKDIPASNVSHIFYAFIGMDSATGQLKLSDEWADAQLPMESPNDPNKKVCGSLLQLLEIKHMNRHLKVLMSIGGWGTSGLFTEIMSNPSKMENFVNSSIELLLKYRFDGIDIDWEYPANTTEAQLLVELLKRLRMGLDRIQNHSELLLTVASPAGDEQLAVMKLREMDKYLSFWNVMCYDFAGGSWSSKTGFHSNLFGKNGDNSLNCSDTIQKYINQGINSRKLVMGMPCYGRCFYNASRPEIGQHFKLGNGEQDTVDYKQLPMSGTQEEFDNRKVCAYSYDPKSHVMVTYDNQQSARIKAKFVELHKLGGGMWWDSAGDTTNPDRSLILNFVDQLGGVQKLDKSINYIG